MANDVQVAGWDERRAPAGRWYIAASPSIVVLHLLIGLASPVPVSGMGVRGYVDRAVCGISDLRWLVERAAVAVPMHPG
jgi:hypothetical protein